LITNKRVAQKTFIFVAQNLIMLLTINNAVLLLSMPGGSEWILIILIVLLMFGGKKIPELMRGVGRGIREFNDAKSNVKSEIEEGIKEKDTKKEVTQ
jgi:sec-independent protein translocase protein TatA